MCPGRPPRRLGVWAPQLIHQHRHPRSSPLEGLGWRRDHFTQGLNEKASTGEVRTAGVKVKPGHDPEGWTLALTNWQGPRGWSEIDAPRPGWHRAKENTCVRASFHPPPMPTPHLAVESPELERTLPSCPLPSRVTTAQDSSLPH